MTPAGSSPPLTRSVIGRLLDELSWAGKSIRGYRNGGIGYGNVLVAETLLGLDFLSRSHFLGSVVDYATGADETRSKVVSEIETVELTVLSPEIKLRPSAGTYQWPGPRYPLEAHSPSVGHGEERCRDRMRRDPASVVVSDADRKASQRWAR